jgi:hypothetical protein
LVSSIILNIEGLFIEKYPMMALELTGCFGTANDKIRSQSALNGVMS